MFRGGKICAMAIALAISLFSPSARAQHHASPPPPHPASRPFVAQRAARQAARQNARQAARANAAHPPAAAGMSSNLAQARSPQTPSQPASESHAPATGAASPHGGQQNARSMQNLPPKWAENLQDRSPEEQERFMQNNERFKSLPPERQQQIRQNLQKWNSLSPTERNAIRDRQATWERMSPQQKQYVQKTLLPKWQSMSPARKQVVTDRLHTLQGMSPTDRQAALNDPKFMQGLNPDEQSVLRGLDSVRNP